MMKMRYNVNTGLYEYCGRLTGEGIFYIFTKVGSEVAKKAAYFDVMLTSFSMEGRKGHNSGLLF